MSDDSRTGHRRHQFEVDRIEAVEMTASSTSRRLAEPKLLRLHIFSVAGRLVRSGRRHVLKIANDWPWAGTSPPRMPSPR